MPRRKTISVTVSLAQYRNVDRTSAITAARALVDASWKNTRDFTANYRRAQAGLEDALRGEPDDVGLLTCLGAVLSDQGFHREAVDVLNKAVALGSTDANTYTNLRIARINLSPSFRGTRLFQRAEKLRPSPDTWEAYFDPQGR